MHLSILDRKMDSLILDNNFRTGTFRPRRTSFLTPSVIRRNHRLNLNNGRCNRGRTRTTLITGGLRRTNRIKILLHKLQIRGVTLRSFGSANIQFIRVKGLQS
ncbi:hypothetical protein Hanom_Chr17g01558181 [Helianthus anomalus]